MSSARAPICSSPVERVRILLAVLSVALLSAPAAEAQVRLRLFGPETQQVRNRQTLSFALSVQNTGPNPRTLELETTLPAGWRQLSAESPFRLEPGAAELRVLGVLVPAEA